MRPSVKRWEMTGNPVKSRVLANSIGKNEASLTAILKIGCEDAFCMPERMEGGEKSAWKH